MSVQPNMPFTLTSGNYVPIGVALRRGQFLCWEVKASNAVAAYVLDAENFEKFEAEEAWEWDEGHGHRVVHEGEYEVPRAGDWVLIIQNDNQHDVSVSFDIWTE